MRPERASPPTGVRGRSRGLVLLALLLFIVLSSLAALTAAQLWSTTLQREREADLLFAGDQYRRAVESYWSRSPGPARTLPTSVRQLLLDDRFPQPVMHLRREYPDPITGEPLQLVTAGSSIVGVHSSSNATPVRHAGFPDRYAHFEAAASYAQWRFVFTPPRPGAPRPGAPRAAPRALHRRRCFLRPLPKPRT